MTRRHRSIAQTARPLFVVVTLTVGLVLAYPPSGVPPVIALTEDPSPSAEPFVGSWQSWQTPRLSTLSSRLLPTTVVPSGYGTLDE